MSENDETEKLKRIVIKTEVGSKWFDEPAKLLSWIGEQRGLYAFHRNISNRYNAQQIFQTFDNSWAAIQQRVTSGLQNHQHDPKNYNNRVTQLSTYFQELLQSNQLFTSDAPFSKFITRQAQKKGEFGVAAIAVIFDANLSNLDRVILAGMDEANKYLNNSEELIRDEGESIQDMKLKWDSELENHLNNWITSYSSKIDEATALNKAADEIIQSWKEQTKEQSLDLNSTKESFQEKFDKALKDSTQELERITATYDDKLALHASVRYWGLQEKQHRLKTKGYGIALGIAVTVVVVGLVLFSNSVLDLSISEIQVSRLVTAAVLTTFGIWLVKILANIFMSHMHLATDAQERRTMIHTYLALTRKGQGPREEDRQLILQTLFRPSTSGMVKDDAGPANLVDLVNRLASKNSST